MNLIEYKISIFIEKKIDSLIWIEDYISCKHSALDHKEIRYNRGRDRVYSNILWVGTGYFTPTNNGEVEAVIFRGEHN